MKEQGRIEILDSIRGIAALVVVLHHCWLSTAGTSSQRMHGNLTASLHSGFGFLSYSLSKILESGRAAVMLFFVLSGFVLTYSLLKKPVSYPEYIIRRIFRIYPAFLFSILASYCLHLTIGVRHSVTSEWLQEVCDIKLSLPLLFGHLAMAGTKALIVLDDVIWTLVHELRISLLFPLVMAAVVRSRVASVLGFLALSVSCTYWILLTTGSVARGFDDISFLSTWFESGYFIVFFSLGSLLAVERENVVAALSECPKWLICLFFLISMSLLLKSEYPKASLKGALPDYMRGLGATGLIGIALGRNYFAHSLTYSIFTWLGRVSYSLYLIHVPVIYVVAQIASKSISPLLLSIFAIGLSLATAEVMVRFVEIPFIKIGRVVGKRWFVSTKPEGWLMRAVSYRKRRAPTMPA